jgi:hypothetical protein
MIKQLADIAAPKIVIYRKDAIYLGEAPAFNLRVLKIVPVPFGEFEYFCKNYSCCSIFSKANLIWGT